MPLSVWRSGFPTVHSSLGGQIPEHILHKAAVSSLPLSDLILQVYFKIAVCEGWECRYSWSGVSAVTCTGEGNNLRCRVCLGFSCCRSDLSNGVLAARGLGGARPEGSTEGSSHIVWPGNLSCRAHCLLLTETTLQSEALERFFHVPLQKKLLEEEGAASPQASAATDWFVYWEAADGSHSLSGTTEISFPYWKTLSFPISPAYRLTLDLEGYFLLWILSSANFDDLLEGAMLSFFPLRSAYTGYWVIILMVVFNFFFKFKNIYR